MPNKLPLAAGTKHLIFVALDRREVLADEPVPLVRPGDSVAQERPTQVEKNFLFRGRGVSSLPSPMGRRFTYLEVVHRIARDNTDLRRLPQPEGVKESA